MENIKYQKLITDELVKRQERNSSYSMRAFAGSLGIDPSQLSRLMSEKRQIKYETALKIASRLYEEKADQRYFLALVELSLSESEEAKENALKIISELRPQNERVNMQLETIEFIKSWYHIAILDLTTLTNFKEKFKTTYSIAKYLGITELQANSAIERMLSLGLLTKKNGQIAKTTARLISPTNIPSKSIRSFHTQMIEKAKDAIEDQDIKERYITGKTMAVSEEIIPEMTQLIEEFKLRVNDLLDSKKNKKTDKLYQLNIQLFNLQAKRK